MPWAALFSEAADFLPAPFSVCARLFLRAAIRSTTGAIFFRHQEVRRFEVHRVDLVGRNEFQYLHSLGGLRLDLLDLFRLYHHVLAFAEFVALHYFAAVNDLLFCRADKLLLYPDKIIAV